MKPHKFSCTFVQKADFFELVYGEEMRAEIASRVTVLGDVVEGTQLASREQDLAQSDFIFTGWGAPSINDLLPYCPRVKAIFFAGGTASYMLNPEIWRRGIQVSSAYAANAVPVAEYTLAAILLGLKGGWRAISDVKIAHHYHRRKDVPGAYGATVGLISCGAIARELLRLLRVFDLRPIVYDPYLSAEEIRNLGAEPADLEEIFRRSDVVSLHSPELEETRGMIRRNHFAAMKPGATFINTARGAIVNEEELCAVARERPDLQFVLDVVHPEPPLKDSALFDLPNVMVTPHIAGAMGRECRRMGQYMVEELDRYLAGEPLRWEITPGLAARSIHRPDFMRTPGTLSAV
ncbi:MAG TPA: hydroxyacid dehydrogenase [Terrimicrobiaceae bacterium]|nr:hydroxyacid dehydrogenase [Terrimicrobiaceae bacterium]